MIGNLILQPVAQEPKIIEPLRDHLHQFALARHLIEEEQEHHLQDHLRIDRDLPVLPGTGRHGFAHETKVERRRHPPQRMIAPHSLLQID